MRRRQFVHTVLASPMLAAGWNHGLPSSFEAKILQWMGVANVPGAVIGVLRNGSPAWVRPLGLRSSETQEAVTQDTVFQAASLSKQIAAYAAFALRDSGKLDFDRTLVSYVDDLPDERARKVTIRHVLSHSSGFPNWRTEAGKPLVPEFDPGARFQYSGEGFFYLQRVMEEVTGEGFTELIERMVFRPLGMTSSAMLWKPELASRFALPHARRGGIKQGWDKSPRRLTEIARQRSQDIMTWRYADYAAATIEAGGPPVPAAMIPNAAGSMVTTAPDYARFLQAAIRNPEIHREQTPIGPLLGWSLGWGIERAAGRTCVWQWGDNDGFKNFVVAEPASGDAVFVFTNSDSGTRIYDRIVTHCTGHDHPALFWI